MFRIIKHKNNALEQSLKQGLGGERVHHVLRAADIRQQATYPAHSAGFSRASVVDRSAGAVHTGLGLCQLEAGGHVDMHVQSYEEYFYVTEGEPILMLDGKAYRLMPGACGFIPIGASHAWLGAKNRVATWIDLMTPIPRGPEGPADTFFVGPPKVATREPLDVRDPRSRHLFRMSDDDIEVDKLKAGLKTEAPKVSAGMNTALLAYSGIAVKMLVDQRLSAALATMFMVEYQPGGVAHPHDHPLEEAYVILKGEVDAMADSQTYSLKEGDVFWTGVGCIHAFWNRTDTTVRWLETSSPAPPARHGYRFNRDWDYLGEKVGQQR
jgi:quercetin dioxygenase-like cupin family protein